MPRLLASIHCDVNAAPCPRVEGKVVVVARAVARAAVVMEARERVAATAVATKAPAGDAGG